MILPILTVSNPILRKKAKKVWWINDRIKKLAYDMLETLKNAQGLGLAAPQVGKNLRIIIACDIKRRSAIGDQRSGTNHKRLVNDERLTMDDYEIKPIILINPKIVHRSKEQIAMEEGCLSLPGYVAIVKRPARVFCKAKNIEGKKITLKADGVLARSIQHEVDHLDGILFIDRAEKGTLRKVKGNKEF